MPYGMNQYLKMTRTEKQHLEPLTLNLDGNCSSPLIKWLHLPDIEFQEFDGTTLKIFRFLDPIFFGKYPPSMRRLVGERLPKISGVTSKFLTGTLDFVGLNHYTSLYARNDRIGIRKLIFNDASTDSYVIATRKLLSTILFSIFIYLLKKVCKLYIYGYK